MAYPLATIWREYEIVKLREGGRMASESMLMQSMIAAAFSKKGSEAEKGYKKMIKDLNHGR